MIPMIMIVQSVELNDDVAVVVVDCDVVPDVTTGLGCVPVFVVVDELVYEPVSRATT